MHMLPDCSVNPPCFDIVAIAASMGGLEAITGLLNVLPATFPAAILVVQHRSPRYRSHLTELLARRTALTVVEATHGDVVRPGVVFVAPVGSHMLLSPQRTLILLDGPPVHYVRPAADLLFSSVASWVGARSIAVVLSGLQRDGAAGAEAIKRAGGRVIVQDQATCRAPSMPNATLRTGCVDFVLPPAAIGHALTALVTIPGAADLFVVSTETSTKLARRVVAGEDWWETNRRQRSAELWPLIPQMGGG